LDPVQAKKMASFVRVGLRRVQGAGRRWTSTYIRGLEEEEHHAVGLTNTWRYISLFGAIPLCLVTAYNGWQKEQEHHHHIEEHGRPEFHAYSHLRIRSKPFPWSDGNHSLFHNPATNALPEGYED
jgi:cytochrome c oxidase subunit 6a